MAKQKHRHIIEATIILAVPFDPTDLAEAAELQKQLMAISKDMPEFRSVTTRMTKEPVPE